jgi:hypothetical protein
LPFSTIIDHNNSSIDHNNSSAKLLFSDNLN